MEFRRVLFRSPPLQGEGWGGDGFRLVARDVLHRAEPHPHPALPLKGRVQQRHSRNRRGSGATTHAAAASARGTRSASRARRVPRSEEHTSELQSLMRISYAVFCLKKKK